MSKRFDEGLEVGRKAGYSHLGRSEMGRDHTIYVSDSAWANLEVMAKLRGMSRSALIDAIGRGEIVLGDSELTAPTVSDNLVDDPAIADILAPPTNPPAPP